MLKRDPEQQARQKAEKQEKARQEADRRAAEVFASSPQGRARSARQAGERFFQIAIPLSETQRTVLAALSGDQTTKRREDSGHPNLLEAIESEGWHLEHAGYVWEQTGSVSRDKFYTSGQTETVTGRIIGVYLFRLSSEGSAL